MTIDYVVVLRGAQGSGKSTRAKTAYPTALVCSADDFFVRDGVYRFDPSKLGEAHAWCMKTFIDQIECADPLRPGEILVVDNTNTTAVEIAPYMAVAASYGIKARIETLMVDWRTAAARNVHGVPEETVRRSYERMLREESNFPKYWEHVKVTP